MPVIIAVVPGIRGRPKRRRPSLRETRVRLPGSAAPRIKPMRMMVVMVGEIVAVVVAEAAPEARRHRVELLGFVDVVLRFFGGGGVLGVATEAVAAEPLLEVHWKKNMW